jgi:peptidylprolyl isomerase
MNKAQTGNIVLVHYTGKLKDGFVFDSSREQDPLQFTIGEGFVLEGFEQAVIGMAVGDKKTFDILADKAYGTYKQELVFVIDRVKVKDSGVEVGQQVRLGDNPKESIIATITDVTDTHITLDANHPLAGQDLTFEIELMGIL